MKISERSKDILGDMTKVGLTYITVGIAIWQTGGVVIPALNLPQWTLRLLIVLVVAGFPISLIMVWANRIDNQGEHKKEPPGQDLEKELISLDDLPDEYGGHNLPKPKNEIIGRKEEIEEVNSAIANNQVVCLTGVGGIGKTRLAIEVLWEQVGKWPGGVWFIPLDSLPHGDYLWESICHVFGLNIKRDEKASNVLCSYISGSEMLILLDNCEHIIESCNEVIKRITRQCKNITILCTSRKKLNEDIAKNVNIPVLETPKKNTPLDNLQDISSVKLLIERAYNGNNADISSEDELKAIRSICTSLEGIPLSLEIAGGWLKIMSAKNLSEEFEVILTGSPESDKSEPHRHHTMWACLDWTFDLLSEEAKCLLKQVAVFSGGAPLDAIVSVCDLPNATRSALLEGLASLVDHNLLSVSEVGGTTRYNMLEPIRQYGLHKLKSTDEVRSVQRRHSEWYSDLAIETESELHTAKGSETVDRLSAEVDNFRIAIRFALGNNLDLIAIKFASLYWFWFMRGYWAEASNILEDILSVVKSSQLKGQHGKVYLAIGTMQWANGKLSEAESSLLEAESEFKENGDMEGQAQSSHIRGHVLNQQGHLDQAMNLFEESLSIWKRSQETHWIGLLLDDIGSLASELENYGKAEESLNKALTISENIGHLQVKGNSLSHLGVLYRRKDSFDKSLDSFESADSAFESLGYLRGKATNLKRKAFLMAGVGRTDESRDLISTSINIQTDINHNVGVARSLESLALTELMTDNYLLSAYFIGCADRLRDSENSILSGKKKEERKCIVDRTINEIGSKVYEEYYKKGRQSKFGKILNTAFERLRGD